MVVSYYISLERAFQENDLDKSFCSALITKLRSTLVKKIFVTENSIDKLY